MRIEVILLLRLVADAGSCVLTILPTRTRGVLDGDALLIYSNVATIILRSITREF